MRASFSLNVEHRRRRRHAPKPLHLAVADHLDAALARPSFWCALFESPQNAASADIVIFQRRFAYYLCIKPPGAVVTHRDCARRARLQDAGIRTATVRSIADLQRCLRAFGVLLKGESA
jgi:hypothetical protein